MKILMLSGITGTGKSTLFKHVKRKSDDLHFSSEMFFSAYHCQNFFKEIDFNFKDLISFYKSIFDFENIECSKTIGILFENSFYNTCLEYNLNNIEISKIERLLEKYQCKQVLLKIPENEIHDRSILTTRIYRKASWQEYLNDFNMDDEGLVNMFKKKQKRLANLVARSPCPTLIIDTSEMNWDFYCKEIIEFWLS